MRRPSFTTTAPTSGLGLVWPRASAASSTARWRCSESRWVAVVGAMYSAHLTLPSCGRGAAHSQVHALAGPGRDLPRGPVAAPEEQRLRAALRLQRGRGLALLGAGRGDVRREPGSGLLPEPLGLHLPP